MLTLGITLFVVGLLLCASIAWASFGFIAMGLGLIFAQIGVRRAKAARSHEGDTPGEPSPPVTPAIDHRVSPTPGVVVKSGKSADELRWKSIVDGDPELARIEWTLAQYGPSYVDQFAKVYVLFNNKAMLPAIMNLIIESARQAAAAQDSASSRRRGRRDLGDGVGIDDPRRHEAELLPPAAEKPISGAQPENAQPAIGSSAQPDPPDTILPAVRAASEEDEQLTRSAVDIEESDSLHRIFEQLNVRKR